jgi:hypothetical protein
MESTKPMIKRYISLPPYAKLFVGAGIAATRAMIFARGLPFPARHDHPPRGMWYRFNVRPEMRDAYSAYAFALSHFVIL